MTEYEYEYNLVLKIRPNTNTIIILFEKSTAYEYEYYSLWKNHPNMNMNTSIRSQLFELYSNSITFEYRIICSPLSLMEFIMTSFMESLIQILFGLKKSLEYEYEYEY